jgi:hypothetical protein
MKAIRLTFTLLVIALVGHTTTRAQDPLLSWNDGPAKQAIVDFVRVTTDQASPSLCRRGTHRHIRSGRDAVGRAMDR